MKDLIILILIVVAAVGALDALAIAARKYDYKDENSNEVKNYKLNKRELDHYLKTGVLPERIGK